MIHDVLYVTLLKVWQVVGYQEVAQGPNVQLEDCEPRYEVEQVLHWRTKSSSARKSEKEYLVLWDN